MATSLRKEQVNFKSREIELCGANNKREIQRYVDHDNKCYGFLVEMTTKKGKYIERCNMCKKIFNKWDENGTNDRRRYKKNQEIVSAAGGSRM